MDTLLGALQSATDSLSVNLLKAAPAAPENGAAGAIVDGFDSHGRECPYGWPALEVDRRTMSGAPPAIWFEKDYKSGKIRMCFEFIVKSTSRDTETALLLTGMEIAMIIKDGDGRIRKVLQTQNFSPVKPQKAMASMNMTLEEFSHLKKMLASEGTVSLEWSAKIPWVLVGDFEAYKKAKKENAKVDNRENAVQGSIPIAIVERDDGDYEEWSDYAKSAFGKVRGLLSWTHATIGKDRHEVWYKDSMSQWTYFFLPQIFRIKADPYTNNPLIRIGLLKGKTADAEPRVMVNFEMGPYYHPRAKRDLYTIINRQSNGVVKYCLFNYGGYDSARFEWNRELFECGIFSSIGAHPVELEKNIDTLPDSSFTVAFDLSLESFGDFQERVLTEGIDIGNVVLTTKEGVEDKSREIKIKADLDLRKLTQTQLGIKVHESDNKKIKFPYKIELTNPGNNDLEIGGCEFSYLSEKKKAELIRDAHHGISTTNQWPIRLKKGETQIVELTQDSINSLSRKNTFMGLNIRKYWTELVCEPYGIRLTDSDLERIMYSAQDFASNKIETWELEIHLNFSDKPDLEAVKHVEIQLRNEELGTDIAKTLSRGSEGIKVTMARNLAAILATQKSSDRKYEYRLKVICPMAESTWSEWKDGSSSPSLYIYDNDVLPLIENL